MPALPSSDVAALAELSQRWVQTDEDLDPLAAESSHFQLRHEIAIETTTGTAYFRLRFSENIQVGRNDFRTVIGIGVSSDPRL